jgi:protease-4
MAIVVNQDGNPSNQPVRVVLEQGGTFRRFGGKLLWAFLIILLIGGLSAYSKYQTYANPPPRIEERLVSSVDSAAAPNKVAIIRVEGTIMHEDSFPKWQIDEVAKDPSVKAIVLRVDSPGGTVTGSDYLYHHLKRLREGTDERTGIPIVVSMGGIAASGGYYISMAAGPIENTIFAERSTWTGSIGVIIPHYNVSELLERWDIKDDSVVSGKFKAMGSPTRKLTPEMAEEEKALLQGLVNQTFEQFKEIVTEARPKLASNEETLKTATTGQIFTAKQALDLGLVDKIGYLEEAVDRAMELASINKSNTRVVKYSPPESLFGNALFGPTAQNGQFNLSALLDLTAPRAYYLCSWLPTVVANQ